MNNPNNLFNMMQTGGLTSTAGGTALARALQRQSDIKKLERQQRAEARRQKRGGLFGSIGSLAGGLLGAALTPFTGGVSLALASGLGAGLGRRVGEGLGAGKSKQYDRSGTVFGQQAFRDVEQASRDYTRGMGERALVSGLQAALTAGFSKDGGIYGSQNPFREGSKFRQALSDVNEYGLARTTGIGGNRFASKVTEQGLTDNPFLRPEFDDVFDPEEYAMGVLKGDAIKEVPLTDLARKTLNPIKIDTNMPSKSLIGMAKDFASKNLYSNRGNEIKRGLARLYGMGGDEFATRTTARGLMDNPFLQLEEADSLYDLYETDSSPSVQDAMMALSGKVNQYNNPLGFQDGGYTAKAILQEAGFTPSEEQLGLFQQFDPGEIERAKERTEQSLLSMTGGMGLSSLGGGFGARQRAATSAIGRGEDLIGDTIEQSQRDFESQTLGTMADLVASGAEFDKDYSYRTNVPTDNPSWSPPPMPSEGATYNFGGQNYIYNGSEWLTEYEFYADEQAGQD
jgi:hypothetical protein